MRRLFRLLALLLCVPAFAQTTTFPPGVFQSRGAFDPAVGGGGGNVTPQDIGTEKYQASSASFNYTGLTITGGLTQPALVCVLQRASGSNNVGAGIAMAWNGTPMTLLVSRVDAGNLQVAAIFGLRAPASGAQTLAVSGSNSAADNFVSCLSFSNVNQASDAAAFPDINLATNVNSIAVTSSSGHYVVGSYIATGFITCPLTLGNCLYVDTSNGSIANVGADYVSSSGTSTSVGSSSINNAQIVGVDVSN